MTNTLEIGKRIEEYRNRMDLTQQELADLMNLTRTAITQIEKGKRNVTAEELYRFSEVLQFPVGKFFAGEKPIKLESRKKEKEKKFRVSIPPEEPDYDKFKNILLYILEKCAGKPNIGETVLYKLLYFSDFNHFEVHEEFLTKATYRKLPYGPVPLHLDQIFSKMIEDGELKRVKATYFNLPQKRYLPLVKADLSTLSGAEKETLDQVIDRYSDWSASAISTFSHNDLPWKATDEGDVIDYELAFYREPPYSARAYDYDEPEEP